MIEKSYFGKVLFGVFTSVNVPIEKFKSNQFICSCKVRAVHGSEE